MHLGILDVPMKSILDPTFKYTKSVDTDLKKTFARIRREMKAQQTTITSTNQPGSTVYYPWTKGAKTTKGK